MKGHGDGILHKNELGLVAVGLRDAAAVRAAFDRLQALLESSAAERPAITMQPFEQGEELFMGVRNDAHFGPVTVVGVGGIDVESARRVAIRVGELDRRTARALVLGSPAGGAASAEEPSVDVGAAVAALMPPVLAHQCAQGRRGRASRSTRSWSASKGRGVAGVDLVVVPRTAEHKER